MELWLFWLAAAALVGGVAATLWRAMARATAAPQQPTGNRTDLALYRDQLGEVERDLARGTLAEDEAARLRLEISRRLLEADRKSPVQEMASGRSIAGGGFVAMGLIGVALAGAVGLYLHLGAPGYPDLPLKTRIAMADELRANRPSQAEAESNARRPAPAQDIEPGFLELMEKLRLAVKERPDDLRGLELLARNEALLGNFSAAQSAQTALIAAKGDSATAGDYAAMAEVLVMSAGGYVSPEAEAALMRALERDPKNGEARYYAGLMFAQIGRFDQSFTLWQALLADSAPDAPWVAALRNELPTIAANAGVNYSLPPEKPALSGPNADDVAAAEALSAQERQTMIEGMVAQLGERLATQGGSAEEFAQLISALGVLGRKEEAGQIYNEARNIFAGQSVDLQGLREAAVKAGVAAEGTGE